MIIHLSKLLEKLNSNLTVGNKKAKTKSRLLNEAISQAVIDEKFQISTIMDVDSNGQPTKAKMVNPH